MNPNTHRCPTRRHRLSACLLAGSLLVAAAHASPPITNINLREPGWSLGLGFLTLGMPYAGAGRWSRFIPLFNVDEPSGFYIHGLTVGWTLWHPTREGFSAGLVVEPETLHYNADFSPRFRGLRARLASAMGGADVTYRAPGWGSRITLLTDLLARNEGQKARWSVFTRWSGRVGDDPVFQYFVEPRAGIEWQSARFIDYYFGIPTDEAAPGRPVYAPSSSLDELVGLTAGLTLGAHFTLMDALSYEWYGAAIRESPLVSHSSGLSDVVGLYFRFR